MWCFSSLVHVRGRKWSGGTNWASFFKCIPEYKGIVSSEQGLILWLPQVMEIKAKTGKVGGVSTFPLSSTLCVRHLTFSTTVMLDKKSFLCLLVALNFAPRAGNAAKMTVILANVIKAEQWIRFGSVRQFKKDTPLKGKPNGLLQRLRMHVRRKNLA